VTKAILTIKKSKKGNLILSITPEGMGGRPLVESVFRFAPAIKALGEGEHEVKVELSEEKKVLKVAVGDHVISKEPVQHVPPAANRQRAHNRAHRQDMGGGQRPNFAVDDAKAPYNFVPLSEKVITIDEETLPAFNKQTGLDGYIELNIEAKSPIYIRKSYDEKTIAEQERLEKEGNDHSRREFDWQQSGFYKPAGGKYRIPGSSLRGMTRTLYEIATHSKLDAIDDRSLYFRSFADTSAEFRSLYANLMMSQQQPYHTLVKAGYLQKRGNSYQIVEAASHHRVEERLAINSNVLNRNLYMTYRRNGKIYPNDNYGDYIKKNPFIKVLYQADNVQNHRHAEQTLRYSKVRSIQPANSKAANHSEGYLMLSGWMRNRREGKHMHWVISEPTQQTYQLTAKQIRDYKDDSERNAVNLLRFANERPYGCPCFFVVENGEVRAFGHTGLFRMVYQNSIGDLRPNAHKGNSLDMTEAVFGCAGGKRTIRGRVFFEDAVCDEAKELRTPSHPKILSNPKPSSFQHYLSQNASKIGSKGRMRTGINNYDSQGARLAGYKFYWHRDHGDWAADAETVDRYKTQHTKIHPLDTGSKFTGKIRFMNLSEAELGALLFVLNLPEGHCHKIGMAKPHGLGSIKIDLKLKLINRKDRYNALHASGVEENNEAKQYISSFAEFLKEQGVSNFDNPWQIPHLRELLAMLDFAGKPDNELTRYMEIQRPRTHGYGTDNEYRNRPILRRPSRYKGS